jgi:hypothetical protein
MDTMHVLLAPPAVARLRVYGMAVHAHIGLPALAHGSGRFEHEEVVGFGSIHT